MPPRAEPPRRTARSSDGTRRCLVSGIRAPRDSLLRFVIAPDGAVVPDVAANLPGRGLWLQCRRDMLAQACAKNLFSRSARRRVSVASTLPDLVEQQLVERCIELVGLARRAGDVVSGFDDVRAWLRRHGSFAGAQSSGAFDTRSGVVIAAQDGAADGVAKIAALAQAAAPAMARTAVLTAAELGRALGRDRAVHAIIRPGPLADRYMNEAGRLAGFRPTGTRAGWTGEQSENGD